jgi:hypothetical protein
VVIVRLDLIRRFGIVALAVVASMLGHPQQSQAAIVGCPSDTDRKGDKIVIGSVTELIGEVGTRRARALLAAFEMRFEKAEADLDEEVLIVYCDNRPVRDSNAYNHNVVADLNDEQLLLEVGARPDGSDILVTYVVIPIRHYAFLDNANRDKGFHKALYEQSRISAGLEQLFKDNAELRLMAALALALRHEKLADGEPDPERRRALVHRSRAFFCDAVGSLEAAKPREGFLGLPEDEWQALANFANAGARRLFGKATGDSKYVGSLAVVASERAGAEDGGAACIESTRPITTGGSN